MEGAPVDQFALQGGEDASVRLLEMEKKTSDRVAMARLRGQVMATLAQSY